METVGHFLVIMFGIGTCGALIALVLTLVDYVRTLTARSPVSTQTSPDEAS